jgi:hypothetical protein
VAGVVLWAFKLDALLIAGVIALTAFLLLVAGAYRAWDFEETRAADAEMARDKYKRQRDASWERVSEQQQEIFALSQAQQRPIGPAGVVVAGGELHNMGQIISNLNPDTGLMDTYIGHVEGRRSPPKTPPPAVEESLRRQLDAQLPGRPVPEEKTEGE